MYLFEVELLQHFLQLKKLPRAARKLFRMLCRPAVSEFPDSWKNAHITLNPKGYNHGRPQGGQNGHLPPPGN